MAKINLFNQYIIIIIYLFKSYIKKYHVFSQFVSFLIRKHS